MDWTSVGTGVALGWTFAGSMASAGTSVTAAGAHAANKTAIKFKQERRRDLIIIILGKVITGKSYEKINRCSSQEIQMLIFDGCEFLRYTSFASISSSSIPQFPSLLVNWSGWKISD